MMENTGMYSEKGELPATVEVLLPRRPGDSAWYGVGEWPGDWSFEPRPGRSLKPRKRRRVRTLRPGQPGTKRLVAQYGDRLVSVRYIYDAETGRRIKTVELLLEEEEWTPRGARIAPDQLVGVRVGYEELGLRESVKRAGARWDRVLLVWVMPYKAAVALRLACRITHAALASPSAAPVAPARPGRGTGTAQPEQASPPDPWPSGSEGR